MRVGGSGRNEVDPCEDDAVLGETVIAWYDRMGTIPHGAAGRRRLMVWKMASGVILFPCILIYFLAQKVFMRGVQVAASKH